jgi:hypothetical protein
MKTPRDILFAHHRQAESKLEAIRRNALATLPSRRRAAASQPGRSEGSLLGAVLRIAWWEFVWPARRAWTGMAALWLAMLAANLELKPTFPAEPVMRFAPFREVVQAFEEQRRLLAELLPSVQPPPVRVPRPRAQPRSERSAVVKVC